MTKEKLAALSSWIFLICSFEVLKADAVVIATGGLGFLFSKSTNSTFCTGAANGRLFMQGMEYANGEFIQIHPTAIPGDDKMRLMSESARGEGGRIWVFGDSTKSITMSDGRKITCGVTGEPWYFLEEMYPIYGNLVPRDIGAREILRICEMGLGVDGQNQVFLDISHLHKDKQKKLEAIIDIYHKFTGEDPRKVPMKIFPAVHYSMGGAWVDWPASDDPDRLSRFRQMTNIPGLFNVGESDYLYHGANRLGANSLLSCIFGGLVAGKEVPRYIQQLGRLHHDLPSHIFDAPRAHEEEKRREILSRSGPENIFKLYDELALWLVRNVTVKRNNRDLQETLNKIIEIRERTKKITLADTSRFANQTFIFAAQFDPMLEIALVITKGALLRNESRGAHAKEEYPERNDEEWLKTTIAQYRPHEKEPHITYRPVEMKYLKPSKRDYTKAEKVTLHFENLPEDMPLPV